MRTIRLVLLVALLLLATPGRRDAMAAATPGEDTFTTSITKHGIELALSLPRRAYPRNALVRVHVSVRNVSNYAIAIGRGPAPEGSWTGPGVEVADTAGAVLYPPATEWILAGGQKPVLPRSLLPGRSLSHTTFAILRTHMIRAVVTIGIDRTVATPLLHLPFHEEPPPSLSVQREPSLGLVVSPANQGQRRPFFFIGGISCPAPPQAGPIVGYGTASGQWEKGSSQRDGAFYHAAECAAPIRWVFAGGWLNHPAVALDYTTPTPSPVR